ncbi:TetR family transcriptional regulator [Kibdelosporangium philippinense]|uniref:TetR family transcriptional regulator n=1 Tax=Kibdelosporangium philippinense TaxID=211113 RepID=A0ABS8ZFH3_9PSEU|nr:TetR family transcriptional regulator [Kibdelosporangium philippinense]MCE7006569.1 TetR family transcriptional regulator [Kibdelosporangium philippinense]
MTDRRAELMDAAIVTLAREGMRGLTHRAVDRAAGVAEGSTSYYFRTREALLSGLLDRLAELSTAEIAAVDPTDIVGVAGLIEHWATAGRDRMLARFELTMESTRRPQLHETMERLGGHFRTMAEEFLLAESVPDHKRRAANLVAQIDGLLFDQITGAGPARSHADLQDALLPLFVSAFAE